MWRSAKEERFMPRKWLIFTLLLGAGAAQAQTVSSHDRDPAKQATAAEASRVEALERSDVAALDRILDENLTYVHASGKVDTKASYLAAIRSGELHYISWKLMDENARIVSGAGDTAVLNGEYAVRVKDTRVRPDVFDVDIFFLTVYARRGRSWRQVAWESTRDVAKTPLK
jgi:hypothetical protein